MSASTKKVSAFTPGPWEFFAKLTASENHRGFFIRSAGNNYWALAEVQPADEDGKEGESNARLIAAAPELLAALKAIVEHGEPIYPADWVRLKEQGIAAIDKATFYHPHSNNTKGD